MITTRDKTKADLDNHANQMNPNNWRYCNVIYYNMIHIELDTKSNMIYYNVTQNHILQYNIV